MMSTEAMKHSKLSDLEIRERNIIKKSILYNPYYYKLSLPVVVY